MSRSTLRIVILLSALFTGLVHLVLLSIQLGGPSPIFILNGHRGAEAVPGGARCCGGGAQS